MHSNTNLIITGVGLSLVGAGAFLSNKLWRHAEHPDTKQKNIPTAEEQERIDLAEASEGWTKAKELPLSKVAILWIDPPEEKKTISAPVFNNSDIEQFYNDYIENKKIISGTRKTVLIKILSILDQFGDTPSVVRNKVIPDVDNDYDENSFSILSAITLREHTLSVARAMAKSVNRDSLLADSLIVSLGHDLGKIPQWHDRAYRTGDHPRISTMALESISEFLTLPNYQGLRNTVAEHHLITTKNGMTTTLKQCDYVVRNQELSRMVNESITKTQLTVKEKTESNKDAITRSPKNQKTMGWSQSPLELQTSDNKGNEHYPKAQKDPRLQLAHPLGHSESKKSSSYSPTKIEIPWFDSAAYLNEIKGEINSVNGNKWGAVSMPDGHIYVNSDCLWRILKNTAPTEVAPSLCAADGNESEKRNLLYSVVWKLSEETQAIAVSMMHPNYHMVKVNITDGSGNTVLTKSGKPLMLTPFKAEAFGALASELETSKQSILRRLVKSIKPILGETNE